MQSASAARASAWLLVAVALAPLGLARCRPPAPPLAAAAAPDDRAAARLLRGETLDPNTAQAEDLALLPGIGPVRAGRIVAEAARRPFASVEELPRVRGIGPRTLERLRPWLAIDVQPGAAVADPDRTPQAVRPPDRRGG